MKKNKIPWIAAAALACALQGWANQPDKAFLFSYAQEDGSGGLKLAWSTDRTTWHSLINGNSVVNSDFGPWGRMKRMFNPVLRQKADKSGWVCTWFLAENDSAMAYVTSPDLKYWNPQKYISGPASNPIVKDILTVGDVAFATVNGVEYEGYINEVPSSLIADLVTYGDSRAYRDALYAQYMKDDDKRFENLKRVKASLGVFPDSTKQISDKLIGIFFEDINYAADGGLYAELVRNRDFEYSRSDRHSWHSSYGWDATTLAGDTMSVVISTEDPIHANNPHYVKLTDGVLTNNGFDGISLQKGEGYRLSFFGRGKANVTFRLVSSEGQELMSKILKVSSTRWKKFSAILKSPANASGASIAIEVKGNCDLDMVSLFPLDTFKGRENGLRRDLAQTLADLHPRFVRFPGGCVAHGNGIDNIYDWKGSIGPLEARKPLSNLWGYHQTRGLGYHEYFLFCEDIGAEPLPVLAAGVPCQNSGTCAHHSHDMVTSYGQQGGIPMEEMDTYIKDILDLIEYANGDARATRWGRERAKAGHPKPFNLKYIGIGNEDMITEVFEERFKMIADAVKQAHPEVKIVGTVGPFYEGTDYVRGWEFAAQQNIPIVDEHYYVSPGWLIHNNDFYDNYDRSKPHVYLGEYASHMPDRASNLEAALSNAIYLTGVERNADVVELSSYAPLLAKKNRTQWRPDLIYFDNDSIILTPDYYVQQMYGMNSGDVYVNSSIKLDNEDKEVKCRVGASVVRDSATGRTTIKLANLLPVETEITINMPEWTSPVDATATILFGNPADTEVMPKTTRATLQNGARVILPPYSFTVYSVE